MHMITIFCMSFLMNTALSAGTISSAELENFKSKASKATFTSAPALVKEINEFIQRQNRYLTSEETALKSALAEYEKTFSLLARINPLNSDAKNCEETKINPHKDQIQVINKVLEDAQVLKAEVESIASPMEFRSRRDSGVCGVFNPNTGRVEWKEVRFTGVAGVYNPNSKKVEWKESRFTGVAGVYNPNLKKVEWREARFTGVAGVYNPNSKQVEWKEARFTGVAGIYNPQSKKIEWKESRFSGVSGFYNPNSNQVEWKESRFAGTAIVYKYKDGSSTSSCGFYGDDGDD